VASEPVQEEGPPARQQPPSRWSAAWFGLRVARQVLKRLCRDLLARPVPRHAPVALAGAVPRLLAEQRSPLWTEAPASEAALVEGKVHNLRLARPSFDGIVVPAGQVLSFWRQLGRPSRRRGYVEGRELREGCAVPVPAGGLCQLSNALVRCAQAAGVEIVERHAHTARIGADAAADVAALDATVFWNYVDLRLRPAFDLAVEVEMDAHELVVRFRRLEAATWRRNSRPRWRRCKQPAPSRGCPGAGVLAPRRCPGRCAGRLASARPA
jgi:vancomycin resistance protein YoaR